MFALIWTSAELVGRIFLLEAGWRHPDRLTAWVSRFAAIDIQKRLTVMAGLGMMLALGYGHAWTMKQNPSALNMNLLGAIAVPITVWLAHKTGLRSLILIVPSAIAALS